MLKGRCLCEIVQLEIEGEPNPVLNCHCHRCRRFTGHFLAATSCHVDMLRLDSGEESVGWYRPTDGVEYGFCRECGSSMFFRVADDPERIVIAAGLFDPPTGLTTAAAWWIDEASDYHCRQSGLTEFARDGEDPAI